MVKPANPSMTAADSDTTQDRVVSGELPPEIDAELMRCAANNGRIAVNYLRDLWLRGSDYGYQLGYESGLCENEGDPRVDQIEAGFKAIVEATGGEYSREDHIVMAALQAGREFAVRLARREEHIRQLIDEAGKAIKELAAREVIIEKYETQLFKAERAGRK